MLAKKYKLLIQKFLKTAGRRKVDRNKFFIIKSKPNNLPFSRFGVTVSGKVDKSAVKRNKIKRIIFNFIRSKEYHLMKDGGDVLIIVLPPVGKLKPIETKKELTKILVKFLNFKPARQNFMK